MRLNERSAVLLSALDDALITSALRVWARAARLHARGLRVGLGGCGRGARHGWPADKLLRGTCASQFTAAAPTMRRLPTLRYPRRIGAGPRPPTRPALAEPTREASLAKSATRRISRSQALGASLLDSMDELGVPTPPDNVPKLPAPAIDRTTAGGDPLDEWKPLVLENELPEGSCSVFQRIHADAHASPRDGQPR